MSGRGGAEAETDVARPIPYWLGGLGAAVVLTGLVFFASRAYRTDAGTAGRLAVLALLYTVAAGVFFLGRFLERRPGLRGGYSLALTAGALAAIYYTTYAAHFVPSLRVVRSPVLGVVLLLACAAGTLWLARQRRSRAMAVLAVLLAMYTSLVPPLGSFTLASNAVLAAAAFLFLVRNGWRPLSLAMVAVTYLAFASWVLYRDGWIVFPLYLSAAAFGGLAALILLYWALFTAPLLLSLEASFTERRRAAFLALNTGFAVGLFGLVSPHVDRRLLPAAVAVLALLLLALAAFLTRRRPAWPLLFEAARTLGLVLLAVAPATLWSGWSTALVLALLALAVALAAEYVGSNVLRALTLLVSLPAAGLACGQARSLGRLAVLVGAVLLFTAIRVDRLGERSPRLNMGSLYFSALGLLVWLTVALVRGPEAGRPLVLAGLALVLTVGFHLIGLTSTAFLSQAFLVAAYVTFLRRADVFAGPSRAVALIVVAGLVLAAWWRSLSPATHAGRWARRILPVAYALASAAVVLVWLNWRLPAGSDRAWLVVPAVLALAALLYALLTDDWAVGVVGQVFLLLSVAQFWMRWEEMPRPAALPMFAPLVALLAVSVLIVLRSAGTPPHQAPPAWVAPASLLARVLACLMFVVWVYWYVPTTFQFLLLEALAVALLWWAGGRGDGVGVALSTGLSTGAVWLFWLAAAGGHLSLLVDPVGFGLLLAQQQLWRKKFPHIVPAALHDPAMVIGVGSLWRWSHLVGVRLLGPDWVAVAWAAVGLVAVVLGLWVHERRYRHLGLVILLAALVRVAVLDAAALPTFPRLVSVLVIGTLLLVLGFAYDRYRPRTPEHA